MNIDAIIEIPMGSRNKYEIIRGSNKIKLDRVLYSSVQYPGEYGYIENTLADDGDCLDILILSYSPTFPGCIVNARILGYLDLKDRGLNDEKIIAVPTGDPRFEEYQTIDNVPKYIKEEISEFFRTYKQLQKVETIINGYHSMEEALNLIKRYQENYNLLKSSTK